MYLLSCARAGWALKIFYFTTPKKSSSHFLGSRPKKRLVLNAEKELRK